MERAWTALDGLLERWESGRLRDQRVAIESATRMLVQLDAHKFFRVRVSKAGVLRVEERGEHLARDARLDGVFILQSGTAAMLPTAIVAAYRQLVSVERAFRTLEGLPRMRPVYDLGERRIGAHVLLCVLTYLLEHHLDQRLRQAGGAFTARAALESLESLPVVEYRLPADAGRGTLAFTRPQPAALDLLHRLELRVPGT